MIRDKRSPPTTPERSKIMSAIRAKNTKPEITVRRFLHKSGLRFRLHPKDMPGRPDIVLSKYKAAIFVHGCFWHAHDCRPRKEPKSNSKFWADKMEKNSQRDIRKLNELSAAGWNVFTIWECEITETKLKDLVEKLRSLLSG